MFLNWSSSSGGVSTTGVQLLTFTLLNVKLALARFTLDPRYAHRGAAGGVGYGQDCGIVGGGYSTPFFVDTLKTCRSGLGLRNE